MKAIKSSTDELQPTLDEDHLGDSTFPLCIVRDRTHTAVGLPPLLPRVEI
jgi:hypothetical protein